MNLKQEDFEKIDRYIRGESDESERSYVESLFLNGEENLYLRRSLHKDWIDIVQDNVTSETDLSRILDKVHLKIIKKETSRTSKPLSKVLSFYMKAAAILLLPLIVAGGLVISHLGKNSTSIIDQTTSSTLFAPMGARVSFNLPDGTTGMLNSGSYLTYSMPFTNNRKISLEGEAWFEVKKDPQHPFEISAGSTSVNVLGTSFNMSAYPAENYVEVVLYEGSVEFKDNLSKANVMMNPSERLVYKDGKTTKVIVDPSTYTAWTEGKLVFRGDPMSELTRRIERWYNVKINIANEELEKYTFHATFQDDTLEDVLRFLCLTSPIRYKITPRKVMPDGSIVKEEVTIYKR
jgi:transmembrane sensor